MTTRVGRRPRSYYRPENGHEILASAGLTMSIPEASAILGIAPSTGYLLAQDGAFPVPVLRIGTQYRVATAEIRTRLGLPAERDRVAS